MKIELYKLGPETDDAYMAILYGIDNEEVWNDHPTNVVTKRLALMVALNMKKSYEQGLKDALIILDNGGIQSLKKEIKETKQINLFANL